MDLIRLSTGPIERRCLATSIPSASPFEPPSMTPLPDAPIFSPISEGSISNGIQISRYMFSSA